MNSRSYINQIYGVTRDPLTHEYAIVTQFQDGGNLRRLISENHTELTWEKGIMMLRLIIIGLCIIHQKNYHHKDFHSGNILNSITGNPIYPTDNNYLINSVISN